MSTPPQGTVTFLFTDIEGSTRLLHQLGDRYPTLLSAYSSILREAAQAVHGYEVDTQGDAFLFAFARAADAVLAATQAQRAIYDFRLPIYDLAEPSKVAVSSIEDRKSEIVNLRVRVGIHTGEPQWTGDRYVGLDLHRGARIMAAGHGGQTLLSQTTQELVRHDLPDGVTLRDLGLHRLKDLRRPRHLYQLVIEGLPSEFPPLKSLDARPNNLPSALTPLVGREADLAALLALMRRADTRLITLVGPGGVGKTRLSLQVGADLLDDFVDGVYFVALAPISDPGLVVGAVAQALGVREQGGRPLLDALREYLREKRLLLVLDNFEQVTGAATAVADILSAARGVKALATSRAPLRIRGEREWNVAPLPLPPIVDRRETDYALPMTNYVVQITQYASVELFIQRAQAVKPGFEVTTENAPAVAEICYRLDGLPLAIELAAARIKLLTPQAMLARLDRRLKLLTGGARDLPERHQTLRAAIDWSHDLLDAGTAALFRRLAVFAGGCTLEAAEAVVSGQETEGAEPLLDTGDWTVETDALEGLAALVGESLMMQRDEPVGDVRFRMLHTIREYALERLEASGEAEAARARHALYFLKLAETAEPALRASGQAAALQQLDAEGDNLRAALGWLRMAGPQSSPVGLRLVYSLAPYWYIRGYFSEGRDWLQAFLALAHGQGAVGAAGDDMGMLRARAAGAAGVLAWAQGDYRAARSFYEESLALRSALGDAAGAATMLSNLGLLANEQGDHATARTLFEQSLAMHRQDNNQTMIPTVINNLALTIRDQGDYATARQLLEEGLALTRQMGDQWRMAMYLHNLGEVAHGEGDIGAARRLYQAALDTRRSLGERRGVASSLHGLARLALAEQQIEAAAPLLHESLSLRQALGERRGIVECLESYARLEWLRGTGVEAVRLLAQCERLRREWSAPRPSWEQPHFDSVTQALREQLGAAVWQSAWDGAPVTDATALVMALLAEQTLG